MPRGGYPRNDPQHMNAGQNVGIGVQIIRVLQQPGGDVLVLHHRRAQVLPVGHQGAEHRGGGEGDHNGPHIPPEALGVLDDQVNADGHQQERPGIIGENEPLAEGDIVVDGRLGGPVVVGDEMLDDEKHGQVHRQIQAPPHMRVLPDKFLDLLHGCSSVIDSGKHDNIIPDKREGVSDICHSFFTIGNGCGGGAFPV